MTKDDPVAGEKTIRTRLDEIHEAVRDVSVTVRGQAADFAAHVNENTTAHKSVFDELARHREAEERHERLIRGHNGNPGLAVLTREHDRYIQSQRSLQRAILIAVILAIGAVLWSMVQDYLARSAGSP